MPDEPLHTNAPGASGAFVKELPPSVALLESGFRQQGGGELGHRYAPRMADDSTEREPTQQTQPKKGEPVEIPVPKKCDVMSFLQKVARTPDFERSDDARGGPRSDQPERDGQHSEDH
jgi:hypothetical protein